MKEERHIDRITEMAQHYQRSVYGDISKLHPAQREETQQAYLAGFFEGMQFGKKLPEEGYKMAFDELSEWFQKRLAELLSRKKS